jgi:hypothetical protein
MSLSAMLLFVAAPGAWHVRDVTAPLDGRRDVAAALEADSAVLNSIGRPFRPLFVLSCDGNKPSAALQWAGYVGRSGYDVAVSWRVDAGQIRTGRWWIPAQPGSSALFLRNAEDVRRLMGELERGRTLVVRAAGQDAVFTLGDAPPAVAAVRAVCP